MINRNQPIDGLRPVLSGLTHPYLPFVGINRTHPYVYKRVFFQKQQIKTDFTGYTDLSYSHQIWKKY